MKLIRRWRREADLRARAERIALAYARRGVLLSYRKSLIAAAIERANEEGAAARREAQAYKARWTA